MANDRSSVSDWWSGKMYMEQRIQAPPSAVDQWASSGIDPEVYAAMVQRGQLPVPAGMGNDQQQRQLAPYDAAVAAEAIAAAATEPSFVDAALRIGVAYYFLRDTEPGEQGVIDRGQNYLLDVGVKFNKATFGDDTDMEVPRMEMITEEADKIIQMYQSLLPISTDIVLNKVQKAAHLHDRAAILVNSLYLDPGHGSTPNSSEITMAEQLVAKARYVGHEELQAYLGRQVFVKAQDTISADLDAVLAEAYASSLLRFSTQVQGRPPTRFFVNDWLTKNISLNKAERAKLGDVYWGFGTDGIYIRTISGSRDQVIVPYTALLVPQHVEAKAQHRYLAEINFPNYADIVRRGLGKLGRLVSDNVAQAVGGEVVFQEFGSQGITMERRMMVRQPKAVKGAIGKVTAQVQAYHDVLGRMQENALGQNHDGTKLIRPNVVQTLMPDPTLLTAPYVLNRDGSHNLEHEEALLVRWVGAVRPNSIEIIERAQAGGIELDERGQKAVQKLAERERPLIQEYHRRSVSAYQAMEQRRQMSS